MLIKKLRIKHFMILLSSPHRSRISNVT